MSGSECSDYAVACQLHIRSWFSSHRVSCAELRLNGISITFLSLTYRPRSTRINPNAQGRNSKDLRSDTNGILKDTRIMIKLYKWMHGEMPRIEVVIDGDELFTECYEGGTNYLRQLAINLGR